jgi:hypothetical protein
VSEKAPTHLSAVRAGRSRTKITSTTVTLLEAATPTITPTTALGCEAIRGLGMKPASASIEVT